MSAPISLSTVISRPDLLGKNFQDTSWSAWRAFCRALMGEPLGEAELELYRACTGRTAPPAVPFREACIIAGRRGGKSRTLALLATYLAVFRDYAPHLAAGEVATIAILAANRDQARPTLRFILGLLKQLYLRSKP